jgi:multidrug resistance efflux pump
MRQDNDHVPAARSSEPRDGRPALSDRVRSLRLAESPGGKRGGSRAGFLPWAACAVLLLTTLVFGFKSFHAPPAAEDASAGAGAPAKAPESPGTPTPTAPSGEVLLEARGYVIAAHQIQISPQVGGEIVWLDPNFKEGAVYTKGDKLAEIDPVIYKAQLDSAKAALRLAQVNLQQVETGSTVRDIAVAEAQLKNMAAKVELAQLDERYNRAAGMAASISDREKSIVQVRVDQAAWEMQKETLAKLKLLLDEQRLIGRSQVNKAQADVDLATKQLKNCTIVAPTTGLVLSKKAELGGYVNPLAFGAAGYLCEMADLRDLEVDLSIQERDIDKVLDSHDCVIRPEAFTDSKSFKAKHPDGYAGWVTRVMPIADRSKGAIAVRVAVEREQIPPAEAGVYLKPDMSVLVSFKKK